MKRRQVILESIMLSRAAAGIIILVVRLYQATLSRFLGGQCRFQPTCSEYMIGSVRAHGPWRGGWRGMKRIARCHPWGGSGYDPP